MYISVLWSLNCNFWDVLLSGKNIDIVVLEGYEFNL